MRDCQNIAAGCVSFRNVGVLITGRSGSGKSALALSLIEKGAVLVSDDRTDIYIKNNQLTAKAPDSLQGLIEVRGIGLVKGLPILQEAPIRAIIHLTPEKPERLPAVCHEKIAGQDILSFSFWENDFFLTNKVLIAIKVVIGEVSICTF